MDWYRNGINRPIRWILVSISIFISSQASDAINDIVEITGAERVYDACKKEGIVRFDYCTVVSVYLSRGNYPCCAVDSSGSFGEAPTASLKSAIKLSVINYTTKVLNSD
jgi:hypothetical protein